MMRLRQPDVRITKNGAPYLDRWWINPSTDTAYHARKWRPAILLHHIQAPDSDRACHNHPWTMISLVIKGGYWENRYDQTGHPTGTKFRRRFTIGVRRRADFHDIGAVVPNTWTLLLVGPKRGDWGFMTRQGFIPWEDYLNEEGWVNT